MNVQNFGIRLVPLRDYLNAHAGKTQAVKREELHTYLEAKGFPLQRKPLSHPSGFWKRIPVLRRPGSDLKKDHRRAMQNDGPSIFAAAITTRRKKGYDL